MGRKATLGAFYAADKQDLTRKKVDEAKKRKP